jgi:hypothetical protein
MITLYTFGPFFGQPDASPFVMKGMLLLKMAGLEFEARPTAPSSRIRPSSATISNKNTVSTTTQA